MIVINQGLHFKWLADCWEENGFYRGKYRKRGTTSEAAFAVVEVRDNGSFTHSGINGNQLKWIDLEWIWGFYGTETGDGLNED